MSEEESFRTIYDNCRSEYLARENIRNISKICYIVLAVIGGILGFVAVCYVWNRTQRLPPLPVKKISEDDDEKTQHLVLNNNCSVTSDN